MKETVLKVADMSCGHCVASVKGALERLDGVESANVSLETKLATVTHHEEVETGGLLKAVQAVGFTPELEG